MFYAGWYRVDQPEKKFSNAYTADDFPAAQKILVEDLNDDAWQAAMPQEANAAQVIIKSWKEHTYVDEHSITIETYNYFIKGLKELGNE